MGTWGTGAFENDGALDWVGDLVDSGELAVVEEALDLREFGSGLDASACSVAIAAAEIVAAMRGWPADELPAEVASFVRRFGRPEKALVLAASSAVTRVLERSELRELWEETADFEEWRGGLRELRRRLKAE